MRRRKKINRQGNPAPGIFASLSSLTHFDLPLSHSGDKQIQRATSNYLFFKISVDTVRVVILHVLYGQSHNLCDFMNFLTYCTGLFKTIVGVLTTCHTQYT